KTFEQYFMPYHGVGVVKNASKDAAVNLEINNDSVTVKLYVTGTFPGANIRLTHNNKVLADETKDLSPMNLYELTVKEKVIPDETMIVITDQHKKVLVSYQPEKQADREIPAPAVAALLPEQI